MFPDLPDSLIGDMFNVFFEADETAIPQILERNDPAKSRVFPYCLADTNGPGTFYLNYDPFTSSLLNISTEFSLTQWHAAREYPHDDTMRTMRQVPVELRTIDSLNLLDDPDVAPPTCMVLDTQGTELAIMQGGRKLISEHTMAIVTEAEFIRFYEGQPLFGDICAALDELGFMFVDFTAGPFKCEPVRMPIGFRSRPMVGFCDALFLRKPSAAKTPFQLAQLSFVAQLYAQLSFGMHCLDLLKKVDPQLKSVPQGRTYRQFLLDMDAARQQMPVLLPVTFVDIYNTYERSTERFDITATAETQSAHLREQYQKMRARMLSQKAELQQMLALTDSPIEAVMNKYQLHKYAEACRNRRVAEVEEMLAELGMEVIRETVPVADPSHG